MALPLLIYIVVEAINGYAGWWHEWPWQTFLNWVLILLILLVFTALLGRLWLGASLVSVVFILFALVNVAKMQARAQPVFLADLLFVKEVLALDYRTYGSPLQINWPWRELIIFLLSFVTLLVLNIKFHLARLWQPLIRLIIGSASAILLVVFICLTQFIELPFYTNITQLYRHNGLPMSIIYSYYLSKIKQPSQRYSAADLQLLSAEIEPLASPSAQFIFPDVIVIMSESFFDLGSHNSKLNTSKLLPYFYRFSKEGFSGDVTSPVFGGSTSVSEFEFLTGHRANFLPTTLQPYVYFIKNKTFALPWLLANHGYQARAYHPFYSDYWNRDVVYPYLGFTEFIADTSPYEEKLLADSFKYLPVTAAERDTHFTSDVVAVRKIVADLISEQEYSAPPQFKFLITLQNHGPHNSPGLFSDELRAEVLPLLEPFDFTEDEEFFLSNYLLNLAGADQSLRLLYQYLNSPSARPTLVVFFGDHQPGLVNNQEIFARLGLLGADDQPLSIYETQFFVWSNYFNADTVAKSLQTSLPEELHLYDLAPAIYQFLGWSLPDYWQLSRTPALRSYDSSLPWQSAQYNLLFEQGSQFDQVGNFLL